MLSPPYVAVIDSTPGATAIIAEHCASPPLRIPVHKPNDTTPVAVDGETMAVNVTDCPEIDGFGLEDKATVVGFLFTV